MRTSLAFALALASATFAFGQEKMASSPGLFAVDAKTGAGLRELFKPSADRIPLLSAHRGGAGPNYPENCLATMQATVHHAWSMLEMDLHPCKDGTIVLMHDPTLDRTSNGKGAIVDHTLAELRELRLKDRQGKLTDYRIPTLDEVFEWARGKTIIVLDKKDVPATEVAKLITAHHAEGYALMMAYNIKDVTDCYAVNHEIVMEAMMGTQERFDEFDKSGVPWANIVAFVGHTATPDAELCRRIHEKGARTMAGTSRNIDRKFLGGQVDTMQPLRKDYTAIIDSGADIMETDIPRDLGPMMFGPKLPTGAKAKFFRLDAGK